MNWDSFFAMGGYAFYVWTSYGLMALVLVVNLILPFRRKATLTAELTRRLQRPGGRRS